MTALLDMPERAEMPLLIAFADLTRFTRVVQSTDDAEVADVIDEYYRLLTRWVEAAEGHVVKFIGDAALIVFTESSVDPGVRALLDIKDQVDEWFAKRGWPCKVIIKIHFGSAIAGPYGPASSKRFDLLGKAVNTTARLSSTGVALTPQAFRKLGKDLRQRFKKHTPPVTYVRTQDAHQD